MKKAALIASLLAAACIYSAFASESSANTGPSSADAAVNSILAQITASSEGSLFAQLSAHSHPGHPTSDFKSWTCGNISTSNSLRLGSITKIFTGFLALSKANLNLFDTVSKHGFSEADYPGANKVRYYDVFSMQSGVPEYAVGEKLINFTADPIDWAYGGDFTSERNVHLGWYKQPLDFPPHSKYCYSNTNYELIAATIKRKTGQSVRELITQEFGSVAPSLNLDDGSTPVGGWPSALGYQDWPYPPTLPGAAGSIRGLARDVLAAYRKIVNTILFQFMKVGRGPAPKCEGLGSDVVFGSYYGFALQRYDQVWKGPAWGHDADLIARSYLVYHPRLARIFLFHHTNHLTNDQLVQVMNSLIKAVA